MVAWRDELRNEDMSVLDRFRLDGKTAVVTGGSLGIGYGMALGLAEAGANVAIASRREAQLKAAVNDLKSRGVKAIGVKTDVLVASDVEALAKQTEAELGAINIWVNNAGGNLDREMHQLADTTRENWNTLVGLNLTSVWWGSKVAAAHMASGGSIINISSLAGYRASPGFGPYGACRAGVMQMTKTLAVELAAKGLRVNCIAPGTVETEMLLETLKLDHEAAQPMAAAIPLGRLGAPEDFAGATVFLASDASSWVTGVTLDISGGQ